jgi:hypothetical protein
MTHLRGDELTGQRCRVIVPFLFGEMSFQHRVRRPMPEVSLEHRRERESATGPPAADPVSPRRHRPGR